MILSVKFFCFCLCSIPLILMAQKAPDGFNELPFRETKGVQLTAFVEKKPGLIGQRVWWSARNITNDRLEIKFVKVINTTCGTTIREDADTYLRPGALVVGSTFSGEITFETQVRKEDCANNQNRVRSVNFENLKVTNLDEKERLEEEKRNAQEKARAAAAAANTPKPSPTSSTSSKQSSNGKTSSSTGNNQSNRYQEEQKRLAKEREEERRQNQLAVQQAQERYNQQMKELTDQSMRRARNSEAVMNVVGSIFQGIRGNMVRKNIESENSRRREEFQRMESLLKDGQHELENCNECDGEGERSCNTCRGSGKQKCGACLGMAGKSCRPCNGSGKMGYGNFQLACTSCFGKGITQCMLCSNTGIDACSQCRGSGNKYCFNCLGTGKKIKSVSSANKTVHQTTLVEDNYKQFNEQQKIQELQENKRKGEEFLEKNKKNPGVITTTANLQYTIIKQGKGRKPIKGDTITYRSSRLDYLGKELYSDKTPVTEVLQEYHSTLFTGKMEALSMIPAGSKYRFYFPNELAFKDHEINEIPAGAALVMEYELMRVIRPFSERISEEISIDSLLLDPIKKDLISSIENVKADSVFVIHFSRSYQENARDTLRIKNIVVHRREDGYYPLENIHKKMSFDFSKNGSSCYLYHVPNLEAYRKIVTHLTTQSKKIGLFLIRENQKESMNTRSNKKQTDDEFWNQF